MKSLLDGLPPEVAQRIHPDWQRNETEYWAARDTLLPQYRDRWIGFANGRVIVSGASAVEVLHAAQASDLHPFVTCVGREHEPSRMRRTVFAYDTSYPHEALPVIPVEFRTQEAVPGLVYEAERGNPGHSHGERAPQGEPIGVRAWEVGTSERHPVMGRRGVECPVTNVS